MPIIHYSLMALCHGGENISFLFIIQYWRDKPAGSLLMPNSQLLTILFYSSCRRCVVVKLLIIDCVHYAIYLSVNGYYKIYDHTPYGWYCLTPFQRVDVGAYYDMRKFNDHACYGLVNC